MRSVRARKSETQRIGERVLFVDQLYVQRAGRDASGVLCVMQDDGSVKSKRCRCGKACPSYNEPAETRPVCCSSCKTESMVDVKNKRCRCGKAYPSYNEPAETRPVCCASCKTESMVNVKHARARKRSASGGTARRRVRARAPSHAAAAAGRCGTHGNEEQLLRALLVCAARAEQHD